ncbi:MAG: hypothetical protein JWN27_4304 [Candidatus Eremiobacteraeota bacterium]|nr:hypothetical protein [Candidatus Eremiobacteraeota bacterium]
MIVSVVAVGRQLKLAAAYLACLAVSSAARSSGANPLDRLTAAPTRAPVSSTSTVSSTTPVAFTARASGGNAGLIGASACAAANGCEHAC